MATPPKVPVLPDQTTDKISSDVVFPISGNGAAKYATLAAMQSAIGGGTPQPPPDGSVTTASIVDSAVTGAKIASGAVTDDKATLANKPAVTCLAVANLTLSALQTIDGTTVVDGSIVLCTAQTTASQNGPWVAHSGAWTRPTWFASGSAQPQFLTELVRTGTLYQGTTWRMTTAAVTVDTTAQTWSITPLSNAGLAAMATNTLKGNATGSSAAPTDLTVAAVKAILGLDNIDVQILAITGTWTKPKNVNSVAVGKVTDVWLMAGGGGGGSGFAVGTLGTAGSGGGGGGGAALGYARLDTTQLGATETVTIGTGGAGGAAASGTANGNVGSSGTDSTFGAWLKTFHGGGGGPGSSAGNAGGGSGGGYCGAGSVGTTTGGAGACGNGTGGGTAAGGASNNPYGGGAGAGDSSGAAGNAGGAAMLGAAGGGSGGGLSASAAFAGGPGGTTSVNQTAPTGGANTGVAGTAATNALANLIAGGNGAGGGGSKTNGAGGAGGAGNRGSGGGGGGAGATGNSGGGGKGGDGFMVAVTYL